MKGQSAIHIVQPRTHIGQKKLYVPEFLARGNMNPVFQEKAFYETSCSIHCFIEWFPHKNLGTLILPINKETHES